MRRLADIAGIAQEAAHLTAPIPHGRLSLQEYTPLAPSSPVNRFPCLLILALLLGFGQARAYDVLCRNGNAAFHAGYPTGVEVDVGPPTQGNLATRFCRATLGWDDQQLVIAEQAAEIDLDLFGADLGDGVPVASFQVKNSAAECCMTYKIYSLNNPPRLLRTLHGGAYFNGADSNLNGQVEIWTDDAAAVDGFEGLRISQLQFLPTCILSFRDGKLLDVSSDFETYYDGIIARIRGQINAQQLAAFRAGGKPEPPGVKAQILELVWAYLYSGREKQAWQALAQMWPPADMDRIRAALLQARARGLRSQVDGVSATASTAEPGALPEHVPIYDSTKLRARPIMVRYYPPASGQTWRGKLKVKLVVDFAGKVWSVRVSGKNKAAYESVRRSAANWKFVPAFVGDEPVASRVNMTISVEQ